MKRLTTSIENERFKPLLHNEGRTIREAILSGRCLLTEKGVENAELDCRVLLEESSGLEHSSILAYPHKVLPAEVLSRYNSFIERRLNREPVSYILGKKEFWSMSFTVTADTLAPRPETETLVKHTLDFIRLRLKENPCMKILDIGTGCGNIPVAIASEVESVRLFAIDISLKALAVAKTNAERFSFSDRIHFLNGNLLAPFKTGVDIIVSNPPYIKTQDLRTLSSDIADYEPEIALDAGDDGLLFYRKIIESCPDCLNSKGGLFFEVGYDQAEKVEEMLLGSGIFTDTSIYKDLSGIPRVVSGAKK